MIYERGLITDLISYNHKEIFPFLMQLLTNENPYIRSNVASSIISAENKNIIPYLMVLLKNNKNPDTLLALMIILQHYKVKDSLPYTLPYIRIEKLRSEVIRTIGILGDKTHIPLLLPYLKDSNKENRSSTITALSQLGQVEQYILKVISNLNKDNSTDVRRALVRALDKFADKDIDFIIASLISDENKDVRKDIINILSNKNNDKNIIRLIKLCSDKDSQVRAAAIHSLRKLSKKGYNNIFLAKVNDETNEVRYEAIKALGDSEDRSTILALTKLTYSKDIKTVNLALEALGKLKNY